MTDIFLACLLVREDAVFENVICVTSWAVYDNHLCCVKTFTRQSSAAVHFFPLLAIFNDAYRVAKVCCICVKLAHQEEGKQ